MFAINALSAKSIRPSGRVFAGDATSRSYDGDRRADASPVTTVRSVFEETAFAVPLMEAHGSGGTLTARLLRFSDSHLIVNVDAPQGEMRAELLNTEGKEVPPFTLENSTSVVIDRTCHALNWRGGANLGSQAGEMRRLRFHLRNGCLLPLRINQVTEGFSRDYVAAGGIGLRGPINSRTGF